MTTTAVAVVDTQTRAEVAAFGGVAGLPDRITSDEEAARIVAGIAQAEEIVRKIVERLAAPKKGAHQNWRAWCDLENEATAAAKRYADAGRVLVKGFLREQREAQEAESRRQAALEAKAAEDRALADAAELERMAQETGDDAYNYLADAMLDSVPEMIVPNVVQAPKIAGLKSQTPRQVLRVKNLRLLCAEIGLGKVPEDVIDGIDIRALQAHVKGAGRVPAGVAWETEDTISVGRRR